MRHVGLAMASVLVIAAAAAGCVHREATHEMPCWSDSTPARPAGDHPPLVRRIGSTRFETPVRVRAGDRDTISLGIGAAGGERSRC